MIGSGDEDVYNYVLAEDKDSGIFIFGTKEMAKEFADSSFKSCDGTFKICPRLYYQGIATSFH